MRILIIAPVPRGSTRGNRITADRWQSLLRQLGHDVEIAEDYQPGNDVDCLIALHARHSHPSIVRFRQEKPAAPVIVCLTGTDLHVDFDPQNRRSNDSQKSANYLAVEQSLDAADQIVFLEPEGQKKLNHRWQDKCHVILQSAEPVHPDPPASDCFLVTVVGHLRPIKDPFRTAEAARLLPDDSRIRVLHIGKALSDAMRRQAETETRNNPRYQWIGPVTHGQALQKLAGSHLTVLSSINEGAPSVISEAVVNRVPVLASRIDASIGLLGPNYPGLFEVGDTQQLAELMLRAESNSDFLRKLEAAVEKLIPRFSKSRELDALNIVLNSSSSLG